MFLLNHRKYRSAVLPILVLSGALLVIAVSKLVTVWSFGNITPFWDQWDAEASGLYKPWVEGQLQWYHLFESHNEHRLLTTRVVHLVLFESGGGRWNPVAQMLVNAGVHLAALLALLYFLQASLPPLAKVLLFVFAGALCSLPFGWENTLSGFQTQFYLLLLLSFLLLWASTANPITLPVAGWIVLLSILLVLTMASGFLTVVVAGLVIATKRGVFTARRLRVLLILALGTVALVAILSTRRFEPHAVLEAQTSAQLVSALANVASWPLRFEDRGWISMIVASVLIQFPLLLMIRRYLWSGSSSFRPDAFLVAFALWLWLQFALLAYGRGAAPLASRYLDICMAGLIANFAAWLVLLTRTSGLPRTRLLLGCSIWLVAVCWGVSSALPSLSRELHAKREASLLQERNVRFYLATADAAWLPDAGTYPAVPYPVGKTLRSMLDDPSIRSFLPLQLMADR